MASMPWDTDRTLDTETVREIVTAQFPEIDTPAIRHLGEGWDFDAYEIDRRWVFRFPKRSDYDPRWLKELSLLDHIAPTLPLPVPVYRFRGMPCEEFPYHFGGYEKLPGQPAMSANLSASELPQVASQLGEFLNSLHRFDPQTARELAIYAPHETHSLHDQRESALADLKRLQGKIPPALYQHCRGFFEDPSRMPEEYEGPNRLLHSDLLAEHILLDPHAGRVTGIIDWSDASAGDPANDFAGFWLWQGGAFVANAMKEYENPVDHGIRDRIRYKALCVAVGVVSYGHLRHLPSYVAHGARCLRNEFPRT